MMDIQSTYLNLGQILNCKINTLSIRFYNLEYKILKKMRYIGNISKMPKPGIIRERKRSFKELKKETTQSSI